MLDPHFSHCSLHVFHTHPSLSQTTATPSSTSTSASAVATNPSNESTTSTQLVDTQLTTAISTLAPTMQSSLNKEELNPQYDLSAMSSLWDPRISADFGSAQDSAVMGHARSISSESASSGYKSALTRDHPSLNYPGVNSNMYIQQYAAGPSTGYMSASEKKEPPSAYLPSRRRGASPRSDDDDELPDEPLDPNATEQEKQAYKRRRNTLAARRSRHRRQVQFQKLEEDVARLNRERDIWKERALMMERMLSTHGLPCPNFSER